MSTQEAEISIQEIWALFKETDKRFKETDKRFKEADKEIDRVAKEVERVSNAVDKLTGKWGRFVEGMVVPAVKVMFKARDIGVEKIFPLHLPTITKIEIKKQAKVRRAKLYFLKRGYKKKLKEKKKK